MMNIYDERGSRLHNAIMQAIGNAISDGLPVADIVRQLECEAADLSETLRMLTALSVVLGATELQRQAARLARQEADKLRDAAAGNHTAAHAPFKPLQ